MAACRCRLQGVQISWCIIGEEGQLEDFGKHEFVRVGPHPLVGGLGFVVAVAAPEDLAAAGPHHAAAPPVVLAAVLPQAPIALLTLCSLDQSLLLFCRLLP